VGRPLEDYRLGFVKHCIVLACVSWLASRLLGVMRYWRVAALPLAVQVEPRRCTWYHVTVSTIAVWVPLRESPQPAQQMKAVQWQFTKFVCVIPTLPGRFGKWPRMVSSWVQGQPPTTATLKFSARYGGSAAVEKLKAWCLTCGDSSKLIQSSKKSPDKSMLPENSQTLVQARLSHRCF